MKWLGSFIICTFCISFVDAAIYKCEDFNGRITYSQTACEKGHSLDKVMNIASSYDSGVECGIVRNFAAEVGLNVKPMGSIVELEKVFGGADNLSTLALKIIRSVHEYQSQPFRTVDGSVHHEDKICKDELYGEPQCSDFPPAFIRLYGSCIAAGDVNKRIKRITEYQNQYHSDATLASNTTETVSQKTPSVLSQSHQPTAREERKECQELIDIKLRSNREKSRKFQSISSQDELRKLKRELRKARSNC